VEDILISRGEKPKGKNTSEQIITAYLNDCALHLDLIRRQLHWKTGHFSHS